MIYFDQILQVLSISAITTTIALFFCGIPICLTIRRQKSIGDISGVPFLMGLLGGSFWLRYGFLKMDWTMIIVNVVGVTFFTLYCLFYMYFSWPKKSFFAQFALVISMITSMLIWIALKPNLDILGIICMTFNIMNFGAPLAGLGVVLKTRNVSSLPLPMCVANFLVSSQWCFYGYLVQDLYVIVPNGIGMFLAIVQLSLFIILPRQEGGMSPLERLAGWFTGRNTEKCEVIKDLEKAEESSSSSSSPKKSAEIEDSNSSLHTRFQRLIGGGAAVSDSRRCSIDLLSHPPSYKSRSSSVPDVSSLQSD